MKETNYHLNVNLTWWVNMLHLLRDDVLTVEKTLIKVIHDQMVVT